jgi:hypothetical protein
MSGVWSGTVAGQPGTSVMPQAPGNGAPRPGWPPRLSPRMLLSLLPSVLISIVAPAVAWIWIRPHVASGAAALAAVMAIPASYTLAGFAWRRRVDPVGVLTVAGAGLALLGSWLAGGSALAIELQDPAETGALGLACLVSVIARRPLYLIGLRLMARRNAQAAGMLADPSLARAGAATGVTAIIGVIFLVHATAITILALSVSPGTFVSLSRPVGLPIFAAGLITLIWYRRRRRAQARIDAPPSADGPVTSRPEEQP